MCVPILFGSRPLQGAFLQRDSRYTEAEWLPIPCHSSHSLSVCSLTSTVVPVKAAPDDKGTMYLMLIILRNVMNPLLSPFWDAQSSFEADACQNSVHKLGA